MFDVEKLHEAYRTNQITSDQILGWSEENWKQIEAEDSELAFDLGVNLGMIHSARQGTEIRTIRGEWADFLDKADKMQADCWNQSPSTIRLMITGLQHELSQIEARIVEFNKNEEIRAKVFGEEMSQP